MRTSWFYLLQPHSHCKIILHVIWHLFIGEIDLNITGFNIICMQTINFLLISIMSINLVSVYIFCIIVSVTVKKDCFTHIHHAYMLSKILYLQIYTHFIKELGIYKSHAEFTTILTTFFFTFQISKIYMALHSYSAKRS